MLDENFLEEILLELGFKDKFVKDRVGIGEVILRSGSKLLKFWRMKECDMFWERRDVVRNEVGKMGEVSFWREYNSRFKVWICV